MLSVLIMTVALSAPIPVAQPPKKSQSVVATTKMTKTTKVVKSTKPIKAQPKVVAKANGRKIHIFHKAKRLSARYVRTGRRHRARLFG